MDSCFFSYPCHKYIHEHCVYEGEFKYDGAYHFTLSKKNRIYSEQYNYFGLLYVNNTLMKVFYKRSIDGKHEYCVAYDLIRSGLCTIYDKVFIFLVDYPLRDGEEIYINSQKVIIFRRDNENI